jgi:hypothetical protein
VLGSTSPLRRRQREQLSREGETSTTMGGGQLSTEGKQAAAGRGLGETKRERVRVAGHEGEIELLSNRLDCKFIGQVNRPRI